MQQSNFNKFEKIQILLRNLWDEKSKSKRLIVALNLANEVIRILGIPENELEEPEEILNNAFSNARFKNQKMETWFEKHPFFGSGRIALQHYDKGSYPVETKFYQLNESFSKARVSATTQIEPNWEDNELTMLPDYKVGIDFFLDSNAKSLSIVLTNQGNLRVMELSERLTNTQIEIFNKLRNTFRLDGIEGKSKEEIKFEPQRTIHQTLWSAFELKEVNKKFYEGVSDLFEILSSHLEKQENLKKSIPYLSKQSKQFVNRLIGRILFLWFLNKKGILSNKFNYFDINTESTEYYNKKLKILFYEVLNTPIEERNNTKDLETPYLNGGLFEPHFNDWNNLEFKFPDKWFNDFYKHLNEFNFTTDESSPEYEQLAIDPEMLGRVFENLLASIVPETSKAASERKNKGAFYTPREIVSFMCKESLKEHIKNSIENEKDYAGVDKLIEMSDPEFIEDKSTGTSMLWGNRSEEIKLKIIESLNNIKVLDPACGSGAFPIGFMQLMVKTLERLSTVYDARTKKHRPAKNNEKFDPHLAKLSILKNSLYGSDIEPMAIEISKLRAWLSLVIDEKKEIEPLPNLEFNFVCANSLIPLPKQYQTTIFDDNSYDQDLDKLIERYFESHSLKEKQKIRKDFNHVYEELSINDNLGERSKFLRTWNPFKFDKAADFFDSKTMLRVDKFDVIIGNPPYIDYRKIDEITKIILKNYEISKFSSMINIYNYFFELGFNKLKKEGILTFITPQQYLIYSNTKGVRELIRKKTICSLSNFSNFKLFEADTYPFVSVIKNSKSNNDFKYNLFSSGKKIDYKAVFSNPLIENITFSKYFNLLDRINYNCKMNLGEIIEKVFVASSNKMDVLVMDKEKTGYYKFIEASDIFEYRISFNNKFITKLGYSDNSFNFQYKKDVIYTTRMTNKIRAFLSTDNDFLGGKVNVIIATNFKFILALLNSKLVNFWFIENNQLRHMNGGALPINTEDLEIIPIPEISGSEIILKEIENLVAKLLVSTDEREKLLGTIDKLIFNLYKLNNEDITIIEEYFSTKKHSI
jgi:hypothetical protein